MDEHCVKVVQPLKPGEKYWPFFAYFKQYEIRKWKISKMDERKKASETLQITYFEIRQLQIMEINLRRKESL